jgi:hypothetical protein
LLLGKPQVIVQESRKRRPSPSPRRHHAPPRPAASYLPRTRRGVRARDDRQMRVQARTARTRMRKNPQLPANSHAGGGEHPGNEPTCR